MKEWQTLSIDGLSVSRPYRGGTQLLLPLAFLFFPPGCRSALLPAAFHSRHPSVRFPGPGFLRPENHGRRMRPVNLRISPGRRICGRSGRAAPFPRLSEVVSVQRAHGLGGSLCPKRSGRRPSVPSPPLLFGNSVSRDRCWGLVNLALEPWNARPAEPSVVAWYDWLRTRNWKLVWYPLGGAKVWRVEAVITRKPQLRASFTSGYTTSPPRNLSSCSSGSWLVNDQVLCIHVHLFLNCLTGSAPSHLAKESSPLRLPPKYIQVCNLSKPGCRSNLDKSEGLTPCGKMMYF